MRQLSDIVFRQSPVAMLPDATVQDACREMAAQRVGSVLVVDEAGRLVGIFTGRDAVCRVLAASRSASRTKLKDVMTPDPDTMAPHMTAIDALRLMWDGGFRHLPVLKDGRVVGVVSRGDFKSAEQDRLEEERELWEHLR